MATPPDNSYAPPKSVVADVSADETGIKASAGSRLGAAMIDGLIFGIPFIPCYVVAFRAITISRAGVGGHGGTNPFAVWAAMAASGGWFYLGVAAAIVSLSVTTLFVHRNGQTIGKKLVGIKVVRTDESRATLARIFWLRYFVSTLLSLIPGVGSFYGLIDLLMIFGKARRCCHDYIADTIVIRA
jgi:uncharacterized RDD family membrane protein YckC